jgi:D-alanine-D-alanine ligase
VVRVSHPAELDIAIDQAFSWDATVIVEQAVANAREIDCGVLVSPEGEVWASLPAEIDVDDGILDFRQKYQAVDSRLMVPADLPDKVAARIRATAIEAFAAIGGYGLARVDFLWDEQADELFVCEINTMPGFTARSSFARAWDASGVPLPKLLSWLIDQALVRPLRPLRPGAGSGAGRGNSVETLRRSRRSPQRRGVCLGFPWPETGEVGQRQQCLGDRVGSHDDESAS